MTTTIDLSTMKNEHGSASIFVWKGSAYLPGNGKYPSGIRTFVAPVEIANLTAEGLSEAIGRTLVRPVVSLPESSSVGTPEHPDVILRATGAKSWKQLYTHGAGYDVVWNRERITVHMVHVDPSQRGQYDPKRERVLPKNTSLVEIVKPILDDLRVRNLLVQH